MRLEIGIALMLAVGSFNASAQGLAELNAAQGGNAVLDAGSVTGGASTIGIDRARGAAAAANANTAASMPPTATLPNPSAGMGVPPTVGAPPSLGAQPGGFGATTAPALPGAMPGAPGGVGVSTPTPIPTIKVLVGEKVYCSVCGTLLEDAVQLAVPQSDADKYFDDGVHDNGIAGDGIRGNVKTVRDQYVGPECNVIKDRLINAVRRAEDYDPMHFFRYHVMTLDPVTGGRRMPAQLDKEQQRDEMLLDWNNKFLADFRTKKDDPRSEFFQLYVPKPPQPPRYPVPPGYVSPQKLRQGNAGAPGAVAAPGAAPADYGSAGTPL